MNDELRQKMITRDQQIMVAEAYNSAMKKLRRAMDGGPDGAPANLTPQEATTLYRMMTESAGMRDFCDVPRRLEAVG